MRVNAGVIIRNATDADLPRIVDIYNHAVLYTTATADCETVSLESRVAWFEDHMASGHPVIVSCDSAGEVNGWASLNPYSPRYGYRFTAENSVYVAPEAQGMGVGTALLEETLRLGSEMGLRSIIAGVDSCNSASLRLHEKFGFEKVAHYRELVFKFGNWLDVVRLQKMLA